MLSSAPRWTGWSRSPARRRPFRRQERESVSGWTTFLSTAGLVRVGRAVSGPILLVVSFFPPGPPAIVITTIVVAAFAGLWFALPLSRRDRDDHQDQAGH